VKLKGRPRPPEGLGEFGTDGAFPSFFAPAPELGSWVAEEILAEGGALHNPDHRHLLDADLEFLWAHKGFMKAGHQVVGQAEQVMFRAGGWQKGRQEQQFTQWFGRVPDFLITLDASYCLECPDVEFCALVEHELYHVAQSRDAFGAPAFTKDGQPKLAIRGHDVEEFIGVVRRYGATEQVSRLVDAARAKPEVDRLNIARACGCCLKVAA
jgi:hypothetical protein